MKIEEVLNDIEQLTLGELVKILSKLRIRVILSIIIMIFGVLYGVFKTGQYFQLQETAVAMQLPFEMTIEKSAITEIIQETAQSRITIEKLVLAKNPLFPSIDNKSIGFNLHKINKPSDIQVIGSLVAQKQKIKKLFPWLSQIEIVHTIYAQNNFNWHDHENIYRFREEYIDKNTIWRYYEDGWILEYKIDGNGRSIPSSFRWVKQG